VRADPYLTLDARRDFVAVEREAFAARQGLIGRPSTGSPFHHRGQRQTHERVLARSEDADG